MAALRFVLGYRRADISCHGCILHLKASVSTYICLVMHRLDTVDIEATAINFGYAENASDNPSAVGSSARSIIHFPYHAGFDQSVSWPQEVAIPL